MTSHWEAKDSCERNKELAPLPGFKDGALARGIITPWFIC